jgi:hypothetical protein
MSRYRPISRDSHSSVWPSHAAARVGAHDERCYTRGGCSPSHRPCLRRVRTRLRRDSAGISSVAQPMRPNSGSHWTRVRPFRSPSWRSRHPRRWCKPPSGHPYLISHPAMECDPIAGRSQSFGRERRTRISVRVRPGTLASRRRFLATTLNPDRGSTARHVSSTAARRRAGCCR